jgi:hypothetical protein
MNTASITGVLQEGPGQWIARYIRMAGIAPRSSLSDSFMAMPDRRYNDDEIAEIFQKASEGPQGASLQRSGEEGMTLAELQAIGREVGISPEAVDRAAKSLDVRPRAGTRKFLGLPLGVERTIELGRRLSEEEWERLVVELREVFRARGVVSSSGSFRQWTNGNLQALLEPTATGHRLRLLTRKGNFLVSLALGAAMTSIGIGALITAGGVGQLATVPDLLLALFGAGYLANATLRLPRWARLRGQQMEAITTRLALETGADVPEDKGST